MIALEPPGAPIDAFHAGCRDRLPMWTVTENPSDYPGKFVARMHLALPVPAVTNVAVIGDTLNEVRVALPAGLVMIARDPADDPCIVEVWL